MREVNLLWLKGTFLHLACRDGGRLGWGSGSEISPNPGNANNYLIVYNEKYTASALRSISAWKTIK